MSAQVGNNRPTPCNSGRSCAMLRSACRTDRLFRLLHIAARPWFLCVRFFTPSQNISKLAHKVAVCVAWGCTGLSGKQKAQPAPSCPAGALPPRPAPSCPSAVHLDTAWPWAGRPKPKDCSLQTRRRFCSKLWIRCQWLPA